MTPSNHPRVVDSACFSDVHLASGKQYTLELHSVPVISQHPCGRALYMLDLLYGSMVASHSNVCGALS